MAQENIVVVRFDEATSTQDALAVLKKADADDRINLKSAAIVERMPDGTLRTIDEYDNLGPIGMGTGGLIGMLIGILGGPVGVLLGWGGGAMLGGAFDIDRAVTSDEALTVLGTAIPAGSFAILADVEEFAVEVIDGEMKKLDGVVTRRPLNDVLGEVGAAEAAADAAAREARRTVREERKAELKANVHESTQKVKEKLHVS
jgi:uncharacterized membrane protein